MGNTRPTILVETSLIKDLLVRYLHWLVQKSIKHQPRRPEVAIVIDGHWREYAVIGFKTNSDVHNFIPERVEPDTPVRFVRVRLNGASCRVTSYKMNGDDANWSQLPI